MCRLQRTVKCYTRSFMFQPTSSLRQQKNLHLVMSLYLHWKILSVPSPSKNTFLCYNHTLQVVLQPTQGISLSFNTLNSKERSNRQLTVPEQLNRKPVYKHSPCSKTTLQQRSAELCLNVTLMTLSKNEHAIFFTYVNKYFSHMV